VLLLALVASLLGACAGNGVVIADGRPCSDWLAGNGRDAYLQTHGFAEYDAGETGKEPGTAVVAQAVTSICKRETDLIVGEALRRASAQVSAAVRPPLHHAKPPLKPPSRAARHLHQGQKPH
jgi:acetoin utilization deacetylase AcuC-like enzyme